MPEICPHCNIPLHLEVQHPNIQGERCSTCDYIHVSVFIHDQRILIAPALHGIRINVFQPKNEAYTTDTVSQDGQSIRFITPSHSWLVPYPQSSD